MKLVHDLEHDLEHTIPPAGGADSQWLFREMTARALAAVHAQPGQQVLDLGCGMGQDTAELATQLQHEATKHGGAIWGLEPSHRMIRWAKAHHPAPSSVNLRWVRALGEELPFGDASFDAVLCKGALDHFISPPLAVQGVARVLKPGGRFVLALANYDSLSCRLGRTLNRWGLLKVPAGEQPYFEPPPDHLTRFGYADIANLVCSGGDSAWQGVHLRGISLLWGFPPWTRLLTLLPGGVALRCAAAAGRLARISPRWADVVLLTATRG